MKHNMDLKTLLHDTFRVTFGSCLYAMFEGE